MRNQRLLQLFTSLGAAALAACASPDPAPGPSEGTAEESIGTVQQALVDPVAICNQDPRVWMNMVPLSVCVGARLFFEETFSGNGRSCGTCHPAANNFTIDAPFVAGLRNTQPLNPLFVNENPAFNLGGLEEPFLLQQFALVKENLDDDFQDPLRFVGRAVNHTFSLATTITRDPADNTSAAVVERTGWGGDGAPGSGTMREFIDGAIKQHYPRTLQRTNADFRLATNTEKDQLVAFQLALGRTADININNVTLTDARAAAGRLAYISPTQGRCNECHGNGGANALASGRNRNFDTGVTEAPNTFSQLPIGPMFDGGFGGKNSPVFTHTTVTGQPDAFGDGTFSTPPVIEAADTGPFFHTHSFGALGGPTPDPTAQIEQAVTFYATDLFRLSPAALALQEEFGGPIDIVSGTQINDIGRFLRVLNVSFNLQLAIQRLNSAHSLNVAFWAFRDDVQKGLISLAKEEADDALRVLATSVSGPLHPTQQAQISTAMTLMNQALAATDPGVRRDRTNSARNLLTTVKNALGTGMNFQLGTGNLMF